MSNNLISFYTLFYREVIRIIRIWPQTLLPPIITMTLYFTIFGSIIGDRVGDIKDISFINFIAPGLVMMAIINNSYTNVSSSFFSGKFQKNLEEMFVSTMSNNAIILGFISGGIFRGLLVGIGVIAVAEFFTDLHVTNIYLIALVAILTATLFSLAGLLNGIYARKFDDITIIPTFILTPLTYLGGVFYSVDLLPTIWKNASFLNPILYMVNSFRYSMLGVSDVNITSSLIIISFFIVLLYATAYFLISRGIGIRS